MRFYILFLVAGVMIESQTAFGQLKFEGGVKAGFNYSSLDLSTVGRLGSGVINNYHWNPSFNLGVYGNFRLPRNHTFKNFAFQPEILFSRQGQRFTTPYNSNLRTALYYVNIPLLIKYYLVGGLNFQFGPQIGILAGSRGDLLRINPVTSYVVGQAKENQSLKPYINPIDLSLVFGTGIDLPFGGTLAVRYCLGISNINKYTNAPQYSRPTDSNGNITTPSISTTYARNQVFQVSLGYRLVKKGK